MKPGFGVIVAGAALAVAAPAAAARPANAAALASAFVDLCMKTGFSAESVEAAFTRLGWKGERLQRPKPAARFSTWTFGFAQVTVGVRPVGMGLDVFSCGLIVREEAMPRADRLRKALQTRISGARLRPDNRGGIGFRYLARLKDEPDEQATLLLSGYRVPFATRGSVQSGRGVLIDYSRISGRYARRAMGY